MQIRDLRIIQDGKQLGPSKVHQVNKKAILKSIIFPPNLGINTLSHLLNDTNNIGVNNFDTYWHKNQKRGIPTLTTTFNDGELLR